MPTYDYVCQACNHELELFQRMSDSPIRKCPSCGRLKLRRLMGTGAGIIFKGSGFYETDYKRHSGSNGTGSRSAPDASKSGETKSESPKSESPNSESPKSESPKPDAKQTGKDRSAGGKP